MKKGKNDIKKTKFNLDDLKIQSFVTSLDAKQQESLKGGTCTQICGTASCPPSTTSTINCC